MTVSQFGCIGKKVVRKDGQSKATGSIKYMADIQMPDMLYGKILHPPYPHALIKDMDIAEAEAYPGVVKVVTAKDVPGQNRHGLIVPDQPVFCDKKVCYLGDTVAVVVAESEDIAEKALDLVHVSYEKLPCVLTPEEGLALDAPEIHEGGNVGSHLRFKNGDVDQAFREADAIVECTFTTKYQEHSYLEPEGGIAVPREDGGVDVYMGNQNGKRACDDLTEILNLPKDKVNVYSHPIGGGFGGKDDLILQGALAVCALVCKKPVHINFSREESFLVGPKRMPMTMHLKMAAKADGTFLANQVRLTGCLGAYTSYGPAIFGFAAEHSCGIYRFPNVDIDGKAVFTNNCFVSAFRGFGNNQMNFAVESMVDMLAEKLGMDAIELRSKNAIRAGERHSYKHIMTPDTHAVEVVEALRDTKLWKDREAFKAGAKYPWLKRGVGFAACQQGVGLGNHCIPDDSTCEVELLDDGRLMVYFGNEDMGQGSYTTLQMIAAEAMHMPLEQVDAICGISDMTPYSGAITASKTTYISGLAVYGAVNKLLDQVAETLGCTREELEFTGDGVNGLRWCEISQKLSKEQKRQSYREEFTYTDTKLEFGLHYFYAHLSQIVGVEVDTLTGETRVLESEIIPASGTIINPLCFEGQCEGGVVMSQGYALYEDFNTGSEGRILSKNFQTYLIPTMADMPEITVRPIEDPEGSGPFGATGIGEPVSVPGSAAIANAIYDALGIRFKDLPCNKEKVLLALQNTR